MLKGDRVMAVNYDFEWYIEQEESIGERERLALEGRKISISNFNRGKREIVIRNYSRIQHKRETIAEIKVDEKPVLKLIELLTGIKVDSLSALTDTHKLQLLATYKHISEFFKEFTSTFDESKVKDEEEVVLNEYYLGAVEYDPWALEYIENPSEEIQIQALKKNSNVFKLIDNPSEEVQKVAVQLNAYNIGNIENPSEEIQKLAVSNRGYAIRYIKNPSEEVKLRAVSQNGEAIRFIENPSEEIQLQAVRNSHYSLKFIDNPSEKVKEVAKKREADYHNSKINLKTIFPRLH